MSKRTGVAVLSAAAMVGLVGALVAFPAVGEAAEGKMITLSLTKDFTASPWTHETTYSSRALGKLGFGVKNLLLGWTDLIVEPMDASHSGENLLKGIGVGLKDGIENELGGAVHLITFPFTTIDAPLPEGGTQLLS